MIAFICLCSFSAFYGILINDIIYLLSHFCSFLGRVSRLRKRGFMCWIEVSQKLNKLTNFTIKFLQHTSFEHSSIKNRNIILRPHELNTPQLTSNLLSVCGTTPA